MHFLSRAIIYIVIALSCASCAQITYDKTNTGKFEGSLDVRWIKPNRFIYVPNVKDPLRFTTSDQNVITPKIMYTDGGSIPRLFWGVPGYSPWGYAPAYIIHDWLFEAHHCDIPDYRQISFDKSATILAECIKTLMETNIAPKDETTLWTIYEAVKSPIAKVVWEKGDSCNPPEVLKSLGGARVPGELLFTIRLDGAASQR